MRRILGIDEGRIGKLSTTERYAKRYKGPNNYPASVNQTGIRLTDIKMCIYVALFKHLGFDVSHLGSVVKYLNEGTEIAVDYFFGSYLQDQLWARNQERAPGNVGLSWFEAYRNGLFLSLITLNCEAEKKLIQWIEPWLPFDESSYLVTEYENHYHKLLAEYLKFRKLKTQNLIKEIEGCCNKRPKLLLQSLDALVADNSKSFSKCLSAFTTDYLKSDFRDEIRTYFSIEASILCLIAARQGITPTGLSEKQTALIMTRETLGLGDN